MTVIDTQPFFTKDFPSGPLGEMSLHYINKHKQLANSPWYFGAVCRNRMVIIDSGECERSKMAVNIAVQPIIFCNVIYL